MSILFSPSQQAFYDDEIIYQDLPSDLVNITDEQHQMILLQLNSGRYILSDLTYSKPKPSFYHVWENGEWIDGRKNDEKDESYISSFKILTRRQFMLVLALHELDDQIELAIANIEDVKQKKLINIEYRESTQFERTSNSVKYIAQLLNLSSEQVDELWIEATSL